MSGLLGQPSQPGQEGQADQAGRARPGQPSGVGPGAYAAGPASPAALNSSIGALLRQVVERGPDRLALVEGAADAAARRRWTYAELLDDAETCARVLAGRFAPGSRIAIWAPNLVEFQIVQYAIALAGMVMVTINPAFRQGEARYVLEQSEAVACFAVREFRGRPVLEWAQLFQADLPNLVLVTDIEDCLELRPADPSLVLPQVRSVDPAQILYTSGTTGAPKGAILTHGGLTTNTADAARAITAGLTDNVVWLVTLPMFHLAGCAVATIGSLALGGTVVTVSRFEAGLALRLIEQERVTTTNIVPTLMYRLLDHPDFDAIDRSAWRSVMLGGATVPAELVRRVDAAGLISVVAFGMTEAAMISATRPDDSIEDKAATSGALLPHVEVKICDPSGSAVRQVGQVGEVVVRGPLTMAGYFRNPQATAETLDGDGWLRTGDLAWLDTAGLLHIAGRSKDVIIRGGENIYPREIEDLLQEMPEVDAVAIIGLPDREFGEIVAAFVKPTSQAVIKAADLRRHLADRLTGYKIPAVWHIVDDFPLTASGKIQKFALRQAWQRGEYQAEPITAASPGQP